MVQIRNVSQALQQKHTSYNLLLKELVKQLRKLVYQRGGERLQKKEIKL